MTEADSTILEAGPAGPAAIRGASLRVGGYLVGMLLSVLSVALLIRHLGVADYGAYVTVLSLITIVQGFTDAGLLQIGVRELATKPVEDGQRMLHNLVGLRLALTSVGLLGAIGFAALAGYRGSVILGTVAAAVGLLLSVSQGTFAVSLQARLRLGWITAMEMLRQILTVAGIVGLVIVGAHLVSFLALSIPVGLAVLAATMLLVRGSVPLRAAFNRKEWIHLLRPALPFAAAVALGAIYLRVTVILMSLLSTRLETGYYATSYRVLDVLMAIPPLVVSSLLPVIARAAKDDQDRFRYVLQRLFEMMLIVGLGFAICLFVGAAFAVHVLAGNRSDPTIAVMRLQTPAVVAVFVGAGWQYGLLSLHRHRALLILSAAALLVSSALSAIFIPDMGAKGAGLAFAAGEVTSGTVAFVLFRRGNPDLALAIGRASRTVAACAFGLLIGIVCGLPSLAATVLTALVYVGALVLLRCVPAELVEAFVPIGRRATVLRWSRAE